jgi:Domain of Unknown Function (DUF930)
MPVKVAYAIRDDSRPRRLAFAAAIVLHLIVVALLLFALPEPLPPPQEEEPISVELVPPPEKPKTGGNQPLPVLQPVIQFGETDAGSKVSPDGNSATDGSASPAPQRDPDKPDHVQPPAMAMAKPITKPTGDVPQPVADEAPALMPADAAKAPSDPKLRQAKTLFSQRTTGNPIATIALGNVPRDVRAARLCATELKEQLLHFSPSYYAEIVPYDRLKTGTVIENASSAFRSNFEWYNLSYRCEIDADATKVVSFAFDIGNRLTQDEWVRRGLPSQ